MKLFIYPPVPFDKTGLATEAQQILQTALLTDIENNTDAVETELLGVNTRLDTAVSKLTTIDSSVDQVEAKLDTAISELQTINSNTDSVESTLVAIAGYVDQIESAQSTAQTSLNNIDTSANNIEATADALNQKLAAALVTEKYDSFFITYIGASTDIQSITYKQGGVSGTTVATVTLGYDGSNRLSSGTKS